MRRRHSGHMSFKGPLVQKGGLFTVVIESRNSKIRGLIIASQLQPYFVSQCVNNGRHSSL